MKRALAKSSFFLFLFGIFSTCFCSSLYAQFKHNVFNESSTPSADTLLILDKESHQYSFYNETPSKQKPITAKNKLIATALAITLGPFGVHRLYLGTKSTVPVMYTLTLGGGFFILPAIDIGYILTNSEPTYIQDNPYLFIWKKKQKSKN